MIAINSSQIEAMLAQIRSTAERASGGIKPPGINPFDGIGKATDKTDSVGKVDFASALKSTIESVNNTQLKADKLGQQFAKGDDSVQLSDVMISMQKANITLQTAVQVRNKVVSAYHDMMNMQI